MALLILPGVAQAASTLTVDDDHVQCPLALYSTIQSAVNAAGPGDTINVCRGTYNESVVIEGPSKNGVSVRSSTALAAAVVKPPVETSSSSPFSNTAFSVVGNTGVQIQRFKLDLDPSATGCSSCGAFAGNGQTGILVVAAEAGLLRENVIVNPGIGIFNVLAVTDLARDNLITGFKTAGIETWGAGSSSPGDPPTVTAQANTLIGAGNPESAGIYGIGIVGPATFTAFGNKITKAGGGIAMLASGGTVKSNNVFGNGFGLTIHEGFAPTKIETNNINDNSGDGVRVGSTSDFVFNGNNFRTNGGTDCIDETTGPGTAGTANTWTANLGNDANRPGICTPGTVVGP